MAASFLSKLQRGKFTGPVRLVVHGGSGVGKSTFAAGAPTPLFLDFEGRTGHLDIARFMPTSWEETLQCLRDLVADPGEFKTIVFDTLDHMEVLIHRYVCTKNDWADIETPGWGKGYTPALLEFHRLITACEMLRTKGLNVVMLAHTAVRTQTLAGQDSVGIMNLKLKGGEKTNSGDYIVEKADLVGYAHWEDLVRKEKGAFKAKAVTTGDRLLTFKHHPAVMTKQGVSMADEIPLNWAAFAAALEANRGV